MLGRGNEHALFHETGGVTHAGYIAADGLDFETIEIGAAKHDARAGGRGQHAHRDRGATVQTDAAALHRSADCLLVGQE